MSIINLQRVFPNAIGNTRNTLPKAKSKLSFVTVSVHHSIQGGEIKQELLSNNGLNVVKVSRIISRSSGKPTKLIRVITDSTNHFSAAQKHGVNIGWLIYRCEPSKESPNVKLCFKCQNYGHSANKCKSQQRRLQCSSQHTVKQYTEPKEKDKCANYGGSHASVYKGCSSYQNAVVEATKRKQDIKYSAAARTQLKKTTKDNPKRQPEKDTSNSTVLATNISVEVAKVLSKIRLTFNTMSYSGIMNVVSNSSGRIFGEAKST